MSQGIEWPLEAEESKEMGSPPEPLGEHIPAGTLIVAHWTHVSLLHNCKIVNLGRLKRVRVCGYLLQQKEKESERQCETVRVAPTQAPTGTPARIPHNQPLTRTV